MAKLGRIVFEIPSINNQLPISTKSIAENNISQFKLTPQNIFEHSGTKQNQEIQTVNKPTFKQKATSAGISAISQFMSDQLSQKLFGNDEVGQIMGGVFSQGVSSAADTISNNLMKGTALNQGLKQNVGSSLAGAGVGIASNFIGRGINALGGDSRLSRGIGQGVATGLGTVGGQAVSNLIAGKGLSTAFGGSGLFTNMSTESLAGAINPYALGASVLGSAIGAAVGPSNEYVGKYGSITRGMDTAYDVAMAGANFIPGVGQGISGIMALNKGLSNIFGSTDGMTKTDAILGSAFMPAPIKWVNMWGSSTTGTFDNQSWQNSEKANSFMGDAFGNLQDKFAQAREEAGKTYGTFSQGAKRRAQENIDYANYAWKKIMKMADQNNLQNIKSRDMASINNQRYAQMLQGGNDPRMLVGKQGMKILNNATNHNIGMRLLSGAALIDNKQMILCSAQD